MSHSRTHRDHVGKAPQGKGILMSRRGNGIARNVYLLPRSEGAPAVVASLPSDLERVNVPLSFDAGVIGPAMLAKRVAPQINTIGSFLLSFEVHTAKATGEDSTAAVQAHRCGE
jgi:hypothetical protein